MHDTLREKTNDKTEEAEIEKEEDDGAVSEIEDEKEDETSCKNEPEADKSNNESKNVSINHWNESSKCESKNGMLKHWVKDRDLRNRVANTFDHKEHIGMDLMDLASEKIEAKSCFNEFAHDSMEAATVRRNAFEKDMIGDEAESMKWNALHMKTMKKWNVRTENCNGKDLEDQSGGSCYLNAQKRKTKWMNEAPLAKSENWKKWRMNAVKDENSHWELSLDGCRQS